MNINELKEQYRTTIAQANGESANEETIARDPDSWLLARDGGYDGGSGPRTVLIGGADEAAAASAEQAAIAANKALAQLQAAKTEAEQLVIDLRARLAELDDVETFARNVNFYRQKQQELETLLGQLNQTRAATEEARDEAQTALRSASLEKGDTSRNRAAMAQEVEANAEQIAQWRQELGNANNVYTGLEMLGADDDFGFEDILGFMAEPSVGYFSAEFDGDAVPQFIQTMVGDAHEFVAGLAYNVQVTVNKLPAGCYMASACWTAHDGNGVYSPVVFEDRAVFGDFDSGWAVRNYQAGHAVVFTSGVAQ